MGDPVTEQIAARTDWQRAQEDPAELRDVAQRLVEDAVGNRIPFGALYKEQKTIVIFLRVREAPGLVATTQLWNDICSCLYYARKSLGRKCRSATRRESSLQVD